LHGSFNVTPLGEEAGKNLTEAEEVKNITETDNKKKVAK
jgi:hypothetical protein